MTPPSQDEGPSIPLFDLRIEAEDLDAVATALREGRLTQGPRVAAFEREFAAHLGVRHAVAVASCTSALHLAYLAAGVGPGDEVIVPSTTFVATAAAVLYCGGTPILVDVVGPDDLGIDPARVEARITDRTKAVCAVHFAGYPAAVDVLADLCRERGVALVEDAAHAPSARLDGRPLGTWGLAGAFSFFSNKVLSAGEGGLLATDDDEVAKTARRLRDNGRTAGGDVVGLGHDHRLDEPRAALLSARLRRLEADVGRRRELTLAYRRKLSGVPGVALPYTEAGVADSSCYVMPLMLEERGRQGPVRAYLRERGVQTALLYPAIHEFSAYAERFGEQDLPEAERVARCEVTVPLFPHMTDEAQDRVVAVLADALEATA